IGEPLGWWSVSRTGFIAAHFHLAAVGFVTLTIVGVGSRMVPMFLFAQTAPTWPLTGFGPVAVGGLLLHASGLLLGHQGLSTVGGASLVLAGSLLVLQVGLWFRHRARREVDPGIGYLLAGTGFLLGTIVLGVLRLSAGGFDPRGWAAYAVVALLGWCTMFTLGVAHRIVPFLSWLHLFGGMSRGAHAPPVTALVHRPLAWASLGLIATGTATLAAGISLGMTGLAVTGGLSLAAGTLAIAAQVVRGFQLWRATPRDPASPPPPSPRPTGRPLEVLS
ncbi:MAG: hypothetical protein KJZ47_10890, partial [Gemmatimonadales bacterium]|nr:hypothetical protein [Gemmatimonadales bacterium]